MDLLQTCAVGFHQLLTYQYHIVAGRKGRTIDFTISFDPSDFHHLAGLHKLTDNVRFLTGKRANIMQEILSGNLTLSHAQRSVFFKQMEPRLKPLAHLEEFLDSNEIVFRYNSKVHAFSAIQADYLLQNSFEGTPVYLFLARRMGEDTQVCRTFFPKSEKDYAEGQPRYTLLKKESNTIAWHRDRALKKAPKVLICGYRLWFYHEGAALQRYTHFSFAVPVFIAHLYPHTANP